MRDDSTRHHDDRPTRAVMALLLSILLLTSAIAPAVGHQQMDGSRSTVDASRSTVDAVTDRTNRQVSHETKRPSTFPDAEVTTLNGSTEDGTQGNGSIPANATTTEVTLITGQTVTVVETGNETRYRVDSNVTMHRVSTRRGTYVFPAGVDLDTFDMDFFNVNLLIQQNLTDGETSSIPVIVSQKEQKQYSTSDGGDGSVDVLDSVEGTRKTRTLGNIGAAAGRVSKSDAESAYRSLASSDEVERVSLDVKYRVALNDSANIVSAEKARKKYGVTGEGVQVAVLDTGIDDSHPDIDDAVVLEKDFTGEGTTDDKYGHGTHVAGIIAGDGSASNGKYKGIAPDADLYNIRVLGEDGYGYTSDIIDGMQYAVDQNADLLSMSLGGSPQGLRSNDPLAKAVDSAYDNGVPVVVSAGNSGALGYGTVGTPGIAKHAITVGATDKSGGITSFSSRGPTPYGLYMKPNLVAPGASIVSARASGTSMGDVVNDYYTSASGTSMSAPIVSGTAALMLDKHPKWSPKRVKSVLTTTADPLGTGVNEYKQGAGMVNATDAVTSNVVVTPGTIDFGAYTNSTNASRVVTVKNIGSSKVTLNVTASASSIKGDTGDVSLNRSQITLAGGETAYLNLTVNTNTSAGIYSGRLSFDDNQYTAIFGYARAHKVTVEKKGIDGTSTDGDLAWLFADKDGKFKTSGFRGLNFLDNGVTTYYLLSDGTYNILSTGTNENNNQSIVLSREISVSSNTNVTLNESDTVKYKLNTTDLNQVHGPLFNKTVEVQYGKETTSNGLYGGGLLTRNVDTQTVRFSTDDRLNVSVEHVLVPKENVSGTASYDVSTIYQLVHATTGVSSGQTFDVNRDQLAAKNMSYYRSSRSQTYDVALYALNTKWDPMFAFASSDSVGDRRTQTVYVSPGNARYGHYLYEDYSWVLYGGSGVFQSGEQVDYDANKHPYTGNLTGWDVSDGSLNFTAIPQGSQADGTRAYADYEWDETLEVRLDGSTVLDADDGWTYGRIPVEGYWYDPIPVDSGENIAVEMHADNPRTSLSTRTITTFETTYVPGEDNTPPVISRVNVLDMNHNSTAGVNPIRVRFTVRNQSAVDTSNVSAWLAPGGVSSVPFEDASGWSQASISRVDADTFEATLTPSDPSAYVGKVDLALKVVESNGDTVEVTTFDAFRGTDTAPPRISVHSSPSDRISQHNPAAISVERTDFNPNATKLVVENNSTGTVVYERNLSSAESNDLTTVYWNATNADGTPVPSGKYDVVVRSSDTYGNENQTTTTVRVDNAKPTTDLTAIGTADNPSSVVDPVYTDGKVSLEATADGTPGGAQNVTFVLSAEFTNFRVPVSADTSDGGTSWTAVGNFSDLPDDGNYSVYVRTVDPAGNRNLTATEKNVTVVLDRNAPNLGATIQRINDTTGRVTVTADEQLQSTPAVEVELPNGTNTSVDVTKNGSVWDGTFALDDSGSTYNATVTGTDLAGNTGSATSTAEIQTVSTNGDKTVTVVLEKSGLFVRFRTNETSINSTVTITESRSALAPLSKNLAGLNFLNGELGKNLTQHLDNATIGVPVNESRLPGKADAKQVNIRYYNESNGNWEVQNTTVRNVTVNGKNDTYWVANVSHFSTYGAVVDDDQPPSLDAQSPDGTTFDWGTTQKRVTFNYSDDISGVDASKVELYFDGNRVTDASATNVTGEYATYNATGLTEGEHTAKVVVVDEAGNEKNYTTTFTVETDSTPPSVTSADPADGTTLSSDTESVMLTVDVTDNVSGVDASAIRVAFDGVDVTSNATISSGQVSYNATGLSPGSSHTLDVYLEDVDGNNQKYTLEFSVAAKSSGGGGGGGGGGSVPPPSVQVEVTELTETYAKAKITNARAASPGDVSFDGGLQAGDATVRGLKIVPESTSAQPKFFVEARTSGSAPSGVPAFDGSSETMGYLTVTPTYIRDSNLDTVGVTFSVDTTTVDSPKNVALYRYDGSKWSQVETKFVGKRSGAYRFEASAEATGTFAVGVAAASFEVTDAALGSSAVSAGEKVTVSATVENVGSGTGTYTAELTVDGKVVATKQVTVAAGEQTTVEFTRAFETGKHTVAVGSTEAGTLTVSNSGATTTSGDSAVDDEQNQQTKQRGKGSSSGIPGFGLGTALAALLAGALLARRRES